MKTLDEAAQGVTWNAHQIGEVAAAHEKELAVLDWDDFSGGGMEVIRHWCDELKAALAQRGELAVSGRTDAWAKLLATPAQEGVFDAMTLAGDRVLMQCEDMEKAVHAARKVAAECGLGFLSLTPPLVNQPVDQFRALLQGLFNTSQPLLVHITAQNLLQYHKGLIQAAETQAKQLMERTDGEPSLSSPFGSNEADSFRVLEERAPQLAELTKQRQRGSLLSALLVQSREKEVPLVFVVVTPAQDGRGVLTAIEEDLIASGGINRSFNLPRRSLESIGNKFIDSLDRDACAENLLKSPAKLGRIVLREGWHDENSSRQARLHLHRLARCAGRKISFEDVINITIRGTIEADEPPLLKRDKEETAYHEAGHALAQIVNSGGAQIPEYATAIPGIMPNGLQFLGVVSGSVSDAEIESHEDTFLDLQHLVRHALAGRAAEELIYGAQNVSTGASNDLEQATQATLLRFALGGFAPGMDKPENSGRNLAVYFGLKGADALATPGQIDRLYELTREFLESEYRATLDMLRTHRRFLDMIVDAMLGQPVMAANGEVMRDESGTVVRQNGDPVLDKGELAALYQRYLAN